MTDDLVKRLRNAADYIEQLEAAMREVIDCTTEHGGASRALKIIYAALGEKKDD